MSQWNVQQDSILFECIEFHCGKFDVLRNVDGFQLQSSMRLIPNK